VNVYADSSVLLRWLLKQPEAIPDWGDWEIAVTSILTRVYARRTVDRMRVQRALSDEDVSRLAMLLRAALAPISEYRYHLRFWNAPARRFQPSWKPLMPFSSLPLSCGSRTAATRLLF
jgi:hypothetical protein